MSSPFFIGTAGNSALPDSVIGLFHTQSSLTPDPIKHRYPGRPAHRGTDALFVDNVQKRSEQIHLPTPPTTKDHISFPSNLTFNPQPLPSCSYPLYPHSYPLHQTGGPPVFSPITPVYRDCDHEFGPMETRCDGLGWYIDGSSMSPGSALGGPIDLAHGPRSDQSIGAPGRSSTPQDLRSHPSFQDPMIEVDESHMHSDDPYLRPPFPRATNSPSYVPLSPTLCYEAQLNSGCTYGCEGGDPLKDQSHYHLRGDHYEDSSTSDTTQYNSTACCPEQTTNTTAIPVASSPTLSRLSTSFLRLGGQLSPSPSADPNTPITWRSPSVQLSEGGRGDVGDAASVGTYPSPSFSRDSAITSPGASLSSPATFIPFKPGQTSKQVHTITEDRTITDVALNKLFPPSSQCQPEMTPKGGFSHRKWICQFPDCKRAIRRQDRMTHALEHQGRKRYSCSCGNTFARSQDKRRHLKEQTDCRLGDRSVEMVPVIFVSLAPRMVQDNRLGCLSRVSNDTESHPTFPLCRCRHWIFTQ
ncbi:hypothetical protein K439DRAFT_1043905 [Ramaria rubella]|nr:hypothetical protein K439DRAFT_1043905 [Ramaria rubella]